MGRVGEISADHVGAERVGDLARHSPHGLDGIQGRAERAAYREERLGLSQSPLLAPEQVGALRLGLLAVGDVAQDRQMPARDEPGRGAVLDVPQRSIGPDHSELPRLLAGREKGLPGGIEPRSRLDELIEPLTEQLTVGHTEQTTGSGVRVDERPRIVDDEHGVAGGREEGLRLWAAGHWIWLSRSRRRHGGRRCTRRYFGVAGLVNRPTARCLGVNRLLTGEGEHGRHLQNLSSDTGPRPNREGI